MDPPYKSELEEQVLMALSKMPYVSKYTTIVVEALLDTDFDYLESMGLEIYKVKQYKSNQHIFIRRI